MRKQYYAGLKGLIIRKWDWWIYRRAFKTLRRMSIEYPGFSYLMELQIRGWNQENPCPDQLKKATELFHESFDRH